MASLQSQYKQNQQQLMNMADESSDPFDFYDFQNPFGSLYQKINPNYRYPQQYQNNNLSNTNSWYQPNMQYTNESGPTTGGSMFDDAFAQKLEGMK
jgi:hypothetical protein